ncbi:hypothetical protein F4804DRAFT_333128 [Jackrogersella minutella]|nr:hypothetical protein F4804DRAFT_333128 [Jackrogersella minutella]
MCVLYEITYACGHKETQGATCAESPNTLGGCAQGTRRKTVQNDGLCDKHVYYDGFTNMEKIHEWS